jgi:hypothetical protein
MLEQIAAVIPPEPTIGSVILAPSGAAWQSVRTVYVDGPRWFNVSSEASNPGMTWCQLIADLGTASLLHIGKAE